MPDIELLGKLRIKCDGISESHDGRKCGSQTIEVSNSLNCRANKAPQNDTETMNIHDGKINIPDYSRSSTNKAADKRACEVLTNEIHIMYSAIFFRHNVFWVHSVCKLKMAVDHIRHPRG